MVNCDLQILDEEEGQNDGYYDDGEEPDDCDS